MNADLAEIEEPGLRMALSALERVFQTPDGDVSPAVETQVQNALHALRSTSADADLVGWLEWAAGKIRLLAEARHQGCVNLYSSQLLRLRRELLAGSR